MKPFDGKVVVVTGGGSGIGRACVKAFSDLGATVVALDLKFGDKQELAIEHHLLLDLTDESRVNAAFEAILREYKKVDVLVNSCGIIHRATVIETSLSDWNKVIAANLTSCFLTSRATLPSMVQSGAGAIINISSGWGIAGGDQASAYCASKGGVVLLTKAMAVDYGKANIRINCVCPGDTDTPLLAQEASLVGSSIDRFRAAGASRPLGRIGKPDEVAQVVVFLASESSSFITGAVVPVDGGASAGTG